MDENSVLSIFNGEHRLFLFSFPENLKTVVLAIGGGGGGEILHLALFCQCLCYLENIFVFLEGKVIKVIDVQKGYI